MIYGYIRVSTDLQSYEGQRYEIEQWCRRREMSVDTWVHEKISGIREQKKRTLGRLLRKMKSGDVLVCTELSRLGRNMMMVMGILNACTQKGLRVYSIKDNFELSDNLNSKIIAFAFSLAAEIERNLISQRTREALAAKKMLGCNWDAPKGKAGNVFATRKGFRIYGSNWLKGSLSASWPGACKCTETPFHATFKRQKKEIIKKIYSYIFL